MIAPWYKKMRWIDVLGEPSAFNMPIILVLSNTRMIRQVIRLSTATTVIITNTITMVVSCRFSQSNILGLISLMLLLDQDAGNALKRSSVTSSIL